MLVRGTQAIIEITDQCYIQKGFVYDVIMYKGIELWSTVSESLERYNIFLYDGPKYKDDFYTLMAIDELDDVHHFGKWVKLSNALAWLKDPMLPRMDC